METKRAAAVYPLAMTAVLAALMAVAAPFSVAIGPVPLSFCTLVIYLAGYLLGGRRAALAALLRIGGDSFTLAAVNDNLAGCGINAVASETGTPGTVEVRFPDVPGIPDGFEALRAIIEDILPCHLAVEYVYWYVTWEELEERFATWGDLEQLNLTWDEVEKLVT